MEQKQTVVDLQTIQLFMQEVKSVIRTACNDMKADEISQDYWDFYKIDKIDSCVYSYRILWTERKGLQLILSLRQQYDPNAWVVEFDMPKEFSFTQAELDEWEYNCYDTDYTCRYIDDIVAYAIPEQRAKFKQWIVHCFAETIDEAILNHCDYYDDWDLYNEYNMKLVISKNELKVVSLDNDYSYTSDYIAPVLSQFIGEYMIDKKLSRIDWSKPCLVS